VGHYKVHKIYLHHTIMNACSKDATASKVPFSLQVSIQVLKYYLDFTQEASSK